MASISYWQKKYSEKYRIFLSLTSSKKNKKFFWLLKASLILPGIISQKPFTYVNSM